MVSDSTRLLSLSKTVTSPRGRTFLAAPPFANSRALRRRSNSSWKFVIKFKKWLRRFYKMIGIAFFDELFQISLPEQVFSRVASFSHSLQPVLESRIFLVLSFAWKDLRSIFIRTKLPWLISEWFMSFSILSLTSWVQTLLTLLKWQNKWNLHLQINKIYPTFLTVSSAFACWLTFSGILQKA